MRSRSASALLSALLLAGCAGQSIPLPGTSAQLEQLPRVDNSKSSPCWQQKQIAAQNSYVDTIKDKTEKVYRAPCEIDKKTSEPKTS